LFSTVVVSLPEAYENPLVIVFNVAKFVLIVLVDAGTSVDPIVNTFP
jgi:hypothetical protein